MPTRVKARFFYLLPAVLIAASLLPAQTTQVQDTSMRAYLSLTDAQVEAVERINAEFREFAQGKYERLGVVQTELAMERAKDPADPLAVGQRQVEIDAIDREVKAFQAKNRKALREFLTPAQLAKLALLQESLDRQQLASQAVCENFLESPVIVPTGVWQSFTFQSNLGVACWTHSTTISSQAKKR